MSIIMTSIDSLCQVLPVTLVFFTLHSDDITLPFNAPRPVH